jgi:hypothetical protein
MIIANAKDSLFILNDTHVSKVPASGAMMYSITNPGTAISDYTPGISITSGSLSISGSGIPTGTYKYVDYDNSCNVLTIPSTTVSTDPLT